MTLEVDYNYQDVRNGENGNLIPYKPFESVDWKISCQDKIWQLDTGGEYKGARYYTDSNSYPLKPYHLMYSQLTLKKSEDTEVKIRVDNLLGQIIDDGDTVWYDPVYTFTFIKRF